MKKTTVVFKRDGARAVAAKADRSTTTLLWITVPAALKAQMRVRSGQPVSTRFRLRVLGSSFGRRYTALKASPTIVPCEDGDLLGHDLEAAIGTDPCKADTDGDHVADGFEYQSALDLNDDEDQDPNEFLPYPGKRPYPNALDPKDAGKDFDGDSLTLRRGARALALHVADEQDGRPHADAPVLLGRRAVQPLAPHRERLARRPPAAVAPARRPRRAVRPPRHRAPADVRRVGRDARLPDRMLSHRTPWDSGARSTTHEPHGVRAVRRRPGRRRVQVERGCLGGYLPDDKRDADADGLSNYEETHGFMIASHWAACYPKEKPFGISYAVGDEDRDQDGVRDAATDADTDGDGIRDGADDEDHDDIPNVMELSRIAASHLDDTDGRDCSPRKDPAPAEKPGRSGVYGQVNPFNPCMPDVRSRTCPRYWSADTGAPFDGSPDWHSLN